MTIRARKAWYHPGEASYGTACAAAGAATSGGHPHGGANRPIGSFFKTADRPQAGYQHKGIRNSTLELLTDESGRATASYRSSGVSGTERIRATLVVGTDTTVADATVTVRWEGLVEVPASSDNYAFEGQVNSHYPVERYLTPGVIEHMDSIWAEYRTYNSSDPVTYSMSNSKFTVTGASLRDGGLYDIYENWANPHNTHGTGRDVDFDDQAVEDSAMASQLMLQICQLYEFEGVTTTCIEEGDHFHAFIGHTHYHN